MVLKKMRFPLLMFFGIVVLYFVNAELGEKAADITANSLLEMLAVIPPVFILLGLLDVWVPKETMIKYLGEHSGYKGVTISFLLGSAAAGPLYGAFPIAAVLMKKGTKFSNVLIFIGAWSTTKIPMLIFEFEALGDRFALTRLIIDILGIIIMTQIIMKFISKENLQKIYEAVEKI